MQKQILVVSTEHEILETIIRLINSNPNMHGTGINTVDQALTMFRSAAYDLVLIGAGLSKEEEQELVTTIERSRNRVPVVFHYGGGSGLLFTEIYGALGKV
ncbi:MULTISPECIES: hypothetical protein [Pedobacter]|uniref:hypothetical protein n=1 Tax=Pedobacter TaxID=84567 RepID=UPI00210B380A|nr:MULTISPECIES: hypothetical protein [unclassified Pedobacter]